MEQSDRNLERYLGEFQPRRVQKLELSQNAGNPWRRWPAVAAVVVFCLGTGYWQMRRVHVQSRTIELKSQSLLLTRVGLHNEKMLDELLTEQSRNVLPSFQGEKSTLRALAKE